MLINKTHRSQFSWFCVFVCCFLPRLPSYGTLHCAIRSTYGRCLWPASRYNRKGIVRLCTCKRTNGNEFNWSRIVALSYWVKSEFFLILLWDLLSLFLYPISVPELKLQAKKSAKTRSQGPTKFSCKQSARKRI